MKILYPLLAVVILVGLALVGVAMVDLRLLFGVALPYAAGGIFVIGVVYRVLKWASSPVPFRIPTTGGQEKSLPWIRANNLESPYNTLGVVTRVALEVLFFRSLFRNTRVELRDRRLVFGEEKLLWLGGMLFHWSMLVVLLRHTRFFTEPAPFFVPILQNVDGFFQIGLPVLYLSTLGLIVGLLYLFFRRVALPRVRYISLLSDYFPLFLILGIATTGALMRHFFRVDVEGVKELAIGLVTLKPVIPAGVGPLFYVHLFLVSSLLAYFPLSKLMHMGGIFLSPTRNLMNNSRMRRHVNPWSQPVKFHTYEEWEDEFRDKMLAAGYVLDEKEPKPETAPAAEEAASRQDVLVESQYGR